MNWDFTTALSCHSASGLGSLGFTVHRVAQNLDNVFGETAPQNQLIYMVCIYIYIHVVISICLHYVIHIIRYIYICNMNILYIWIYNIIYTHGWSLPKSLSNIGRWETGGSAPATLRRSGPSPESPHRAPPVKQRGKCPKRGKSHRFYRWRLFMAGKCWENHVNAGLSGLFLCHVWLPEGIQQQISGVFGPWEMESMDIEATN